MFSRLICFPAGSAVSTGMGLVLGNSFCVNLGADRGLALDIRSSFRFCLLEWGFRWRSCETVLLLPCWAYKTGVVVGWPGDGRIYQQFEGFWRVGEGVHR